MNSQSAFRAGLLDPSQPTPSGLQNATHGAAGKRYDVYRNNVTHSLIEALERAFPFVRKLIGAQRFTEIAPKFVRAHPPRSPLMMFYGTEFPAFLEAAPELQDIGYLPDAARLDITMRQSYHAADAPVLAPETLQAMPPEALMAANFTLTPATIILRSPWPLFDIWQFTFVENAPQPQAVAQDILITRPDFDPTPHLLPEGAAEWLEALAAGQSFAMAHETAITLAPGFDLETTLTLALQIGALEHPTKELK